MGCHVNHPVRNQSGREGSLRLVLSAGARGMQNMGAWMRHPGARGRRRRTHRLPSGELTHA